MSTPPRPPNNSTTSSTTKTPYVKYSGKESQASTPVAPAPEEPRSDKYDEIHREKLKRKIENLTKQINGYEVNADYYDPNINHYSEAYANSVEETRKMVFKLPKKNGGRKSTKRGKKHQKKTSKKRSRK
jgi:hypothetical protein